MKTQVQLIYDAACPNVARTREALLRAFANVGVPASWEEWQLGAPECPPSLLAFGSPTVLVNGRDVAGGEPGSGGSCRLYYGSDGLAPTGTPSISQISAALEASPIRRNWQSALLALPGIGALLLPLGVCPACWPAYAGVLASLGVSFFSDVTFMLPIVLGLLGLTIFGLAAGARSKRRYGPLYLGVLGSLVAAVGKFALATNLLVYGGLVLIVASSVWNVLPTAGRCWECETGDDLERRHDHKKEMEAT